MLNGKMCVGTHNAYLFLMLILTLCHPHPRMYTNTFSISVYTNIIVCLSLCYGGGYLTFIPL